MVLLDFDRVDISMEEFIVAGIHCGNGQNICLIVPRRISELKSMVEKTRGEGGRGAVGGTRIRAQAETHEPMAASCLHRRKWW